MNSIIYLISEFDFDFGFLNFCFWVFGSIFFFFFWQQVFSAPSLMAFHIAVLSIAFVSITFFSKSGNKADNSDLTVIVVSNQFNSCGEDILYTKDFDVHDVKNCFAALSLVISALLQNGQFFELLWSIKTFVIRWKISSSINSIFSHSLILSLTFLAKLSFYSWIILTCFWIN